MNKLQSNQSKRLRTNSPTVKSQKGRQISEENRRIQSIIANSRMSIGTIVMQKINERIIGENKERSPTKAIFPRQRRYSLNIEEPLKSQEYIHTIRNFQNLSKKLQRMKDSIEVLPEAKVSPSRVSIRTKSIVSMSEPSEVPALTAVQQQWNKQVIDLLQNIQKNMVIFSKLFESSRNKPELIGKLHGWDDEFFPVMFQNKQVKTIIVQEARVTLGLEKKTIKSKNLFNKLKLLLGQLMRLNSERQNLLAAIQKQKIRDEMNEIEHIERNYYSNCKGLDREQYEKMVNLTRSKVFQMKSHVRDKNNLLKTIEQQTGGMNRIDTFFRKQEENLASLETLLTNRNSHI